MSGARPIYLDYAATTPVDPRVTAAMNECLGLQGDFGNPSSGHAYGRSAARRVAAARAQLAALVGCASEEVVFTSGATEADNLAIFGAARAPAGAGRHLVTARTEHRAVLDPMRRLEKEGFEVTWLSPRADGRIDPDAVRAALRPDTRLVSIMHVNNETGVINDVAAIGATCRERDVLLHCDAAQSVGRLEIDLRRQAIDLLSISAHKLCGPKGIGALVVRPAARPRLAPQLLGGGQERGLRAGTLATHQIVGFGVAAEIAAIEREHEARRLGALRERLWQSLQGLGGVHLNGAGSERVAAILNVSFEGVEGESLVTGLPELALSTGSACSSASAEPSHVLRALGRSTELAQSSLRLSLGRFTTEADVEAAASAIARELYRLRSLAGTAGASPGDSGAGSGEDSGLSPLAWQYFRKAPCAGSLAGAAGPVVCGEAGGESAGTRVRIWLEIEGDSVTAARFQAYGCPHTLAVTAWVVEQLPGRRRATLVPGDPAGWAAVLDVPVEKLGRLFVVEDALQACLREWQARA